MLSNRTANLSGRVLDAQDEAVSDSWVILYSTDPQRWFNQSPFVRQVRSDRNGHFGLAGVPPGDYLAAAVDSIAGNDWRNPDVLRALMPWARSVTLREGQELTAELRVQMMPE